MVVTRDWKMKRTGVVSDRDDPSCWEALRDGVLAHGFRDTEDYGFIPVLAQRLAEEGFIAHRFNQPFRNGSRPWTIRCGCLPEDTWNHQVEDLLSVVERSTGSPGGHDDPLVLFGHSRGGVACLLTAGRHADDLS